MQTDANFGNYLFDAASGRIALIDFGATETVTPERVAQMRELGRALRADDAPRLVAAAYAAGQFQAEARALPARPRRREDR